jgi:diketogulonate reductase-like aldo/keto reductase
MEAGIAVVREADGLVATTRRTPHAEPGWPISHHAFDESIRKLGVEQLDLLILHQPLPSAFDRTLEAYRALETLLADGKVRAIGVSNFMPEHLDRRAGICRRAARPSRSRW